MCFLIFGDKLRDFRRENGFQCRAAWTCCRYPLLLQRGRLALPSGRRGGESQSGAPSPRRPAQQRGRCPARCSAVRGGRQRGRRGAGPKGRGGRRPSRRCPPPPRTHRPFPTLILISFPAEALLFLPVLPFGSRAWNTQFKKLKLGLEIQLQIYLYRKQGCCQG